MRLPVALLGLSFVGLLAVACGGGNTASQLAKAPEYNPKDQTKCGVTKSQAKPLIVEWPSADRGELEAQAHNRGVVVVRYQGCEMQVLDGCTAPVKYGYSPITRKKDRVVMRDADDLYANIPVGAARLEAKLEKSGELDVDMTMVGRWEAERREVRQDELKGSCDGATHVVSALTVGAFTFSAGADAAVGGGATVMGAGGTAQSTSKRETLNADGDASACEKSTPDDKGPPANCGAMLRVEVVPIAAASPAASVPSKSRPPSCPDGTTWNGNQCAGTVNTDCAGGLHFVPEQGCVPNVVAAAPPQVSAPAPAAMGVTASPAAAGAGEVAFDRGAAAAALGVIAASVATCKREGGPTGTGHISIAFRPDGTVESAVVDQPPFAGTAVGGCIAGKFRGARVPAFSGGTTRVGKGFAVP